MGLITLLKQPSAGGGGGGSNLIYNGTFDSLGDGWLDNSDLTYWKFPGGYAQYQDGNTRYLVQDVAHQIVWEDANYTIAWTISNSNGASYDFANGSGLFHSVSLDDPACLGDFTHDFVGQAAWANGFKVRGTTTRYKFDITNLVLTKTS